MTDLQTFLLVLISGLGVMFLGALIVKFLDVGRASRWPVAPGRILKSTVESRQSPRHGAYQQTTVATDPHVVYEYEVKGKTYQSDRLTLDEGIHINVKKTLARYPVAAAVPVYYDPVAPSEAVLEREPLNLFVKRILIVLSFVGGSALAVIFGLTDVDQTVARAFPDAKNADVLIVSGGMGVLLALFGLWLLRDALKERRWAVAPGVVLSSTVDSYTTFKPGRRSVTMKLYRPLVIYRYEVTGRQYESNQIRRGVMVGAGDTALAERTVQRYPAGGSIQVRYNPEDPGESILETGALTFVAVWIVAAVMFVIAASAAGYVPGVR